MPLQLFGNNRKNPIVSCIVCVLVLVLLAFTLPVVFPDTFYRNVQTSTTSVLGDPYVILEGNISVIHEKYWIASFRTAGQEY